MDYGQTVEWMFAKLPMYQRDGASAYRKDLTNTLLLAEHLGNPEKHLTCIHIAGTNGKGSVSHMLASILMESGYRVGLFTSPHLKDYRERIKINGEMIPEDYVVSFVADNKDFFESNSLSFFEMTTGLAFGYFNGRTDVCIIETGMGGRLDSTNIITPILSVITNIGLDHVQFLGPDLQSIAGEKAGIIKRNVPVVVGQHNDITKPVFETAAAKLSAPIVFAQESQARLHESDLKGNYQRHNIKTVMAAVERLINLNLQINLNAVTTGLMKVLENTGLRGRWEKLSDSPTVICDTAHNHDGLTEAIAQVMQQKFDTLRIVLGTVNDKDLSILQLFPGDARYYFCKPDIPRGLDCEVLKNAASKTGLTGNCYDSVKLAYKAALQESAPDDLIFIGGSTFVVAEIL